jgi:inactivated superfamily I helicase/RecB family exonuclease
MTERFFPAQELPLRHLARSLLEMTQDNPVSLTRHWVILPTLKALRALKDELTSQAPAGATFLPQLWTVKTLWQHFQGEEGDTTLLQVYQAFKGMQGGESFTMDMALRLSEVLRELSPQGAAQLAVDPPLDVPVTSSWAALQKLSAHITQEPSLEKGMGIPWRCVQRLQEIWSTFPPDFPLHMAGFTQGHTWIEDLKVLVRQQSQGTVWSFAKLRAKTPPSVTLLEAMTPEDEAQLVALYVREVLEDPQACLHVICPDLTLAKRLQTHLRRWNILVDTSKGESLKDRPVGQLVVQLLRAIQDPEDILLFLSVLHNPLVTFGLLRGDFAEQVRQLELVWRRVKNPEWIVRPYRQVLEMLAPQNTLAALLVKAWPTVEEWGREARPLMDWMQTLHGFLTQIVGVDNPLIQKNQGHFSQEWQQLEVFLSNFASDSCVMMPLKDFETYLHHHLTRLKVMRVFAHPRVALISWEEAALTAHQTCLVMGANRVFWSENPRVYEGLGPAFSKHVGLPLPAAYRNDVLTHLEAVLQGRTVTITRSLTQEGRTTEEAFWLGLLREGAHQKRVAMTNSCLPQQWQGYQQSLHQATKKAKPAPIPSLEGRPQTLSVTELTRYINDPYAFYARHILKVIPLPGLQRRVLPVHYGIWVHEVLANCPHPFSLEEYACTTRVPLWRHAFLRILPWLKDQMLAQAATEVKVEQTLSLTLEGILLEGRYDRFTRSGNRVQVVDYKTGVIPSGTQMVRGLAPQLPLLVMMAQQAYPTAEVTGAFWDVKKGRVIPLPSNEDPFYQNVQEQIGKVLRHYQTPGTVMAPGEGIDPATDPYAHLKREAEWTRSL